MVAGRQAPSSFCGRLEEALKEAMKLANVAMRNSLTVKDGYYRIKVVKGEKPEKTCKRFSGAIAGAQLLELWKSMPDQFPNCTTQRQRIAYVKRVVEDGFKLPCDHRPRF